MLRIIHLTPELIDVLETEGMLDIPESIYPEDLECIDKLEIRLML